MVSDNTFRVLGYIYTGLCLTGSFLLIINSSNTVKITDQYGDSVSGVSVVMLIISLIAMVFNVFLTFGLIMRRVDFIRYHLRFVFTVYVLLLIAMFVGCIVLGITLGKGEHYGDANQISSGVIAMTLLVIFGIILITIKFALIIWVLKGIISVITKDMMRLISSDGNEMP